MAHHYVLLCLSAALGGAVNALAGGGTLLTFPVLLALLHDEPHGAIVANATSTFALVPGALAAVWGYRREMEAARHWAAILVPPSLCGGLAGALLLVALPDESFRTLVPWLILAAALLFALQPQIARYFGIGRPHAAPSARARAGVVAFQFVASIYGGYFGAGTGILMLAALALMGLSDIHQMNGLKSLLGASINSLAVVVFVVSGSVRWPFALAMAAAAIVGGYGGAQVAQRLDRTLVRHLVSTIGFGLAAYYFYVRWFGN